MVQIPEFKAKTQITSQTGTRARPVVDIGAAAAAPFEAAAGLASDVQKISSRFYQAQTSLQRKTETSKLIDQYLKGNENTPGLNQLSFDAQNNPDTNTALPGFQKGSESLIASLANSAKDPVVKQLFTSKANEIYNNEYLGVQSAVWKNIREDGIKTLERNIKFENNQIMNAGGNSAKENSAWMNIEKLIEDANADGLGLPNDYYQTVKDKIYLTKAETLAYENPSMFLENNKSGFYDDKLTAENRLTLTKVANNAVTKTNNKYIATVKSEASALSKNIGQLSDIGEYFNISTWDNLYLSVLQNDAIQKQLGLPGMEDELGELLIIKNNFEILDDAKASRPDDVKEKLDSVRKENTRLSKDPNANIFEQKALNSLEDSLSELHSKMITDMKDNLLNLAEELDPETSVEELNFFGTSVEEFYMKANERNETAKKIAEFYGVPIQLIKKEEREKIKQGLETGSLEEVEDLLTKLSIVGQENLKTVFNNLGMGKHADVYTHVGLILYNNGGVPNETTRSILKGIQASGTERSKDLDIFIKEKVGVDELADLALEYSPSSTADNLENLTSQISQATEMIFLDKINRNEGNLIENNKKILAAYEQSIQMASGLTKKGNEYYGGWQDFGEGNKIILPQNMINSEPFTRTKNKSNYPTVKEMMEEAMTPDLLEKAFSYEFDVYDSASGKTIKQTKTVLPFTEEGQLSVEDLFETEGKNIFFDDDGKLFDNIFLETADDGLYYIGIGDNNSGTAEYFVDENGNDILFNLKKIVPDLLLAANE